MTNLFIFSNDLRLQDNEALYEASLNADALEAVFLFSPNKWKLHNESSLKIKFHCDINIDQNTNNSDIKDTAPKKIEIFEVKFFFKFRSTKLG